MPASGPVPLSSRLQRPLLLLTALFVLAVTQLTLKNYPTYFTSSALPNAVIALLWLLALAGAGDRLNAMLLKRRDSRPDLLLGLATGLGAAGTLCFALALVGGLTLPLLSAFLALCWLAAADSYRRLIKAWRVPSLFLPVNGAFAPFCVAFFSAFGMSFLMLAYAALPPSFYDSLVNHLALPQQYLLTGGLTLYPHQLMSYYPHLHEWLLCFPLAIGGPEAANLFTAFIMLATLALVGRIAWRLGGRLAALLAFTVAVGLPMVIYLGADLKSDSTLAFFLLAAFVVVLEAHAPRRLLLAGFFLGAACAVKSTAFVAAPSLFVAWMILERPRDWAAWRTIGTAGLLAGLVALPHLLPAWITHGSPFYPQLSEIFGAAAGVDYARLNSEIQAMHEVADFPHFFYNIFFNPMAVDADNAILGTGFLLLLPTLFFVPRTRTFWAILAAWALTLLPIALLTTKLRFYPFFYLLPAVIFGVGLARLIKSRARLALPLAVLLALLMGHNANLTYQTQSAFFSGAEAVFSGNMKPSDFLGQNQGQLKAYQVIEAKTKPDARILLDGEPRFAYLNRRVEAASPYERSELARALASGEAPSATLARLKRAGFTAVYVALKKHVGGELPLTYVEILRNQADPLYEDGAGMVLLLR